MNKHINEATHWRESGSHPSNPRERFFQCLTGNVHSSLSTDDVCEDVIIVGGGVAGCYAAWRLATQNASKSVLMYEASGRIGGRLYSKRFPNSTVPFVELGAASFLPQLDELMNRTVHDLGLRRILHQVPEEELMYYLRGRYLRKKDLNSSSLPYNLEEDEKGLLPEELLR